MKEFWNERYSQQDFVYGETPNEYFKSKLDEITVGSLLLPAEGEGRNAVYAASKGWDVKAFDSSTQGKVKAERLAQQQNVKIDYTVADIDDITYPAESFDAIALIFAHFQADKRKNHHQKLSGFLKKGGFLIIEGFSKQHVKNQKVNSKAGGPRDEKMLYNLEELKKDFEEFSFIETSTTTTLLSEGAYHVGEAGVVRIFAQKK